MIVNFTPGLVLREFRGLQPPFTSNPHDSLAPGQKVSNDGWAVIPGMWADLSIESPGLIEVAGHVGFQIEGAPGEKAEIDDKFMIGVALQFNGKLVREPIGTMATMNEVRDTHYHDMAFIWALPVKPGKVKIEIVAWAAPKRGAEDAVAYFKERDYSGAVVKVFGSPA